MNWEKEYKFSHIDLVKYCGASGDFNPIHTVTHVAERKGFKDVIVPGLMTMGLVSRFIEEQFQLVNLNQLDIRFVSPIYPDEKLFFKFEKSSTIQYLVNFQIIDNEGVMKAKGSFQFSNDGEE